MRAGILLIALYWALFTIRAGLQPKVAAEVKAATYDMKRASGLEKLEHTRRLQCWTYFKGSLKAKQPCASAAGLKTSCWAWLSCGLLSCWAQS